MNGPSADEGPLLTNPKLGEPNGEHLTHLLSDISKSFSGSIRSLLGKASSSAEEPMSLASLITGSNCLKTCGMDDLQYAARKAADLFMTVRVCFIVLTCFLALYLSLLIALRIYKFVRRKQSDGNTVMPFLTASRQIQMNCAKMDGEYAHGDQVHDNAKSAPPIYAHLALHRSDSSAPSTTAAGTPLPIPPPTICHNHPMTGESNNRRMLFGNNGGGALHSQQQQQHCMMMN